MMDGCSEIYYFLLYHAIRISVGTKYYEGVLGGMLDGGLGGRLFGV